MSYQIVVGVDGSENSTRALGWSVEEARLREGHVTAVFAWQFPMIGVPGAFERDQLEQQAKALISHHVAEVAGDANGHVEPLIANGETSASLVAACEHAGADLLVLGSSGRGRLGGVLVGSVEQQCIAYAPCPVLIVKDKVPAAS
jgi:nucleotide-binding universal stress UspA family protein